MKGSFPGPPSPGLGPVMYPPASGGVHPPAGGQLRVGHECPPCGAESAGGEHGKVPATAPEQCPSPRSPLSSRWHQPAIPAISGAGSEQFPVEDKPGRGGHHSGCSGVGEDECLVITDGHWPEVKASAPPSRVAWPLSQISPPGGCPRPPARTGASPGPGRDSPASHPRHTGRSAPCGCRSWV